MSRRSQVYTSGISARVSVSGFRVEERSARSVGITRSYPRRSASRTVALTDVGNEVLGEGALLVVAWREAPVRHGGSGLHVLGPRIHDALPLLVDLIVDRGLWERLQHQRPDLVSRRVERADVVRDPAQAVPGRRGQLDERVHGIGH